jgi:NADPH-dependent 2,4-dienoyl-CoA reductase/sulfur reductase-like enzyme
MSMNRTGVICLTLLLAAGCGARPQAFSDNARPIAEEMAKALQARDVTRLDRSLGVIEERFKRKNVRDTDYNTIKAVYDHAKAGDWEAANTLLNASIERSK